METNNWELECSYGRIPIELPEAASAYFNALIGEIGNQGSNEVLLNLLPDGSLRAEFVARNRIFKVIPKDPSSV